MSHSYRDDYVANMSANCDLSSIVRMRLSRRAFLKAAGSLTAFSIIPVAGCATTQTAAAPEFSRIGVSTEDTVWMRNHRHHDDA